MTNIYFPTRPPSFADILHAKAEKIAGFCGRVNLGLVDRLALANHRRGEDAKAVVRRDEIGCAEKHGRAGGT